ncbi:hypothetical protein EDB80DRAFT_699362 [Ilyonectria destructans]|nr:hypothetical protein EDB80DRAFT_699362 [Ilyonectria destructans]
MAGESQNIALIFGASGISGWSLMRECLSYRTKHTFSRVIGLSNRPLSREAACIPDDARLAIHTGLDLTNQSSTCQKLETIPDIRDVTHVYFVAYTGHGGSERDVVEVNSAIVDNALVAVNKLCSKLRFVTLQTGGKGYGAAGHPFPPAPWKENLPRLPEPFASDVFYYAQYDVVARHAARNSWKWSEIRPSFLQGFVPNGNAMNIALSLGLYLSFYRSENGDSANCVFPGTIGSWTTLHTDSFQDLVARLHIHVSLHPEKVHGRSFNIGDGKSVSWEMKWPIVCAYFGLTGVGPPAKIGGQAQGKEWLMAHKHSWSTWTKENGLGAKSLDDAWSDVLVTSLSMPVRIDFDLGASRDIGFSESMEPGEGFLLAFDRLREAKFLP